MRTLIAAALLLAANPVAADIYFLTGAKLAALCELPNPAGCWSYVEGAIDSVFSMNARQALGIGRANLCLRDGDKISELADRVRVYYRSHEYLRDAPAGELVIAALECGSRR